MFKCVKKNINIPVIRSLGRNIISVDVSNLDKKEADEYLRKLIKKYRNKGNDHE